MISNMRRLFDSNYNFHLVHILFMYIKEIGASNNICVETFAGPEPASEYETQALTKFITEYAGDIKMYLAFHSYGQYFMFPYGYTTAHVPEYDGLVSHSNLEHNCI